MKIEQLETQYQPAEDRILLRISSLEVTMEYYITRRFLKLLLNILIDLLEKQVPMIADKPSKQMVLAFEQHVITEKFNYTQKSRPKKARADVGANTYPLLHTISVKMELDTKTQALHLHDKYGEGVILPIHSDMLHLLYKLLVDTAEAAEWQLDTTQLKLDSAPIVAPHRLN